MVNERSKDLEAVMGAIGAGDSNTVDQFRSFIGGGQTNVITNNSAGSGKAINASIPGGDHLRAVSYAQTIVGEYNKEQGQSFGYAGVTRQTGDRLFIVGNGSGEEDRRNAFEVSENGHSIVYHTNGSGGATPTVPPTSGSGAIYGATYRDNIVYAWGDFNGSATTISPHGDFGVQSIIPTTVAGRFRVALRTVDPYTGAAIPSSFSEASITATVVTEGLTPRCLIVNVTPIGVAGLGLASNEFYIIVADPTNSCNPPSNVRVNFKVCGRD